MKPLVSVIIPCHNYGRFLGECVSSIRSQTLNRWEAIVVNDGSDDNTRAVLGDLCATDSRVIAVHQNKQGVAAARNRGVAEARGEFFQFLDADDLLEPRKLENHVAFLEDRRDVGIVYGGVRYFKDGNPCDLENRERFYWWTPGLAGPGRNLIPTLLHSNVAELGCLLVRSSVRSALAGFDSRFPQVADWAFLFRAALAGILFGYSDADGARVLMRGHTANMSGSRLAMKRAALVFRQVLSAELHDEAQRTVNRALYWRDLQAVGYMEAAEQPWTGGRKILRAALAEGNMRSGAFALALMCGLRRL
jgi:GT2 family glycosyltransferase